jgi:hypothetical protein
LVWGAKVLEISYLSMYRCTDVPVYQYKRGTKEIRANPRNPRTKNYSIFTNRFRST